MKGDRVREHLSRTERELYGILQRKYELLRGPGGRPAGASTANMTSTKPSWEMSGSSLLKRNESAETAAGPYGSVDDIMTSPQVWKKRKQRLQLNQSNNLTNLLSHLLIDLLCLVVLHITNGFPLFIFF